MEILKLEIKNSAQDKEIEELKKLNTELNSKNEKLDEENQKIKEENVTKQELINKYSITNPNEEFSITCKAN